MRTKTETLLNNTSATTYIYDGAGRLVSETTDGDTISYTYDARGNRVHMNNAGTVTTYSYDANNRLLSETTQGESIAYTYDANGNTLSAGSKSYTYNSRGQQTGYTDGTTTASYAYNPSGLRSAKTVGGATKYFVYNGMNIVYEYNAGGTEATVYYYGLNRTHNSDGEIYVYNAHGDVIQLVKNNAVVVCYTYDAFGNITEQIGTSENPFLYCGEYFDAETETYYLRARYYNPANGRFTQQDAWGYMNASDPLSLNLYTYCFNNPIMYVDPSGHWPNWGKLVSGALLATIGVLSVAAIAATGGAATPVVALAYASVATAGSVAAVQGASEVIESFSGENPAKDFMGDTTYEVVKAGSLSVISFGVELMNSGTLNVLDNRRSQKPIYSANGNPELRAERRPVFDQMRNGFKVGKQTFKLNTHAYNSLFKSGRKDIMPDDIIAALKTPPVPGKNNSLQYVNPNTGTSVFVNPTSNEIVGIWPEKFFAIRSIINDKYRTILF